MPDFCSENKEVITDSNYNTPFPGDSCLPGGQGFPKSSISENGVINSGALSTHIKSLLNKTKAIAPGNVVQLKEMNPAEEFAAKSAALRKTIQTEYCYYYVRYTYILQTILMTAAVAPANKLGADYEAKKKHTEELNSKLNQILQIIQGVVNSRLTSLKDYYGQNTGVNQVNTYLDTVRTDLIEHAKLLKNQALEKELKGAMVDYTIEKNSSSRNLLAIYGFMNIVAAGLIFYLYRSAKSQ